VDRTVRRHHRDRFLVVLYVVADAGSDLVEYLIELPDKLLHTLKLRGSAFRLLLVEPGDGNLRCDTRNEYVAQCQRVLTVLPPCLTGCACALS
jgi:hypothetical protein